MDRKLHPLAHYITVITEVIANTVFN